MSYYIITSSAFEKNPSFSLIQDLPKNKNLSILNEQAFIRGSYQLNSDDKFFLPSDTSYPIIHTHLDTQRASFIATLRDKHAFRQYLSPIFPSFYFETIELAQLAEHSFNFNRCSHYMIKPVSGFMGVGARIVHANTNLMQLKTDIASELKKFSVLYPNIFSNTLLIEHYIGGTTEYAVDMFYDQQGIPIITNLYCHKVPKRKEYLQMLYYTHRSLFDLLYQPVCDFFRQLNQTSAIRSFPIHAEFKLDPNTQQLIPIEFNAGRFGGMGLAILTRYAFGFNPIQRYFSDTVIPWSTLWRKNPNDYFCWLLAYNAADRDPKTHRPSHDRFKQLLPKNAKILAYEALDYLQQPGFALVYLQIKEKSEIEQLLMLEFNDFFVPITSRSPIPTP